MDLYSDQPRGGNRASNEAQFQGRVVNTVFLNQQEVQDRKQHMNDNTVIHPYKKFPESADARYTDLRTNEVALKPRENNMHSDHETEIYKSLYAKNPYAQTDDGNEKAFILSSYNGFYITPYDGLKVGEFDQLPKEEKEYYCRKPYQLAGIVGTNNDSNGFHGEIGRPDLPVQLGGIYTIANFGQQTIYAGDLVVWNCPDLEFNPPAVADTPAQKLVVRVEPYNCSNVYSFGLMKKLLTILYKFIETMMTFSNLEIPEQIENTKAILEENELRHLEMLQNKMSSKSNTCTPMDVCAKYIKLITKNDELFSVNAMMSISTLFSSPATKELISLKQIIKYHEDFFLVLAENRSEYHSRIVGRAVTTGIPGNEFDIYMQNYCI